MSSQQTPAQAIFAVLFFSLPITEHQGLAKIPSLGGRHKALSTPLLLRFEWPMEAPIPSRFTLWYNEFSGLRELK